MQYTAVNMAVQNSDFGWLYAEIIRRAISYMQREKPGDLHKDTGCLPNEKGAVDAIIKDTILEVGDYDVEKDAMGKKPRMIRLFATKDEHLDITTFASKVGKMLNKVFRFEQQDLLITFRHRMSVDLPATVVQMNTNDGRCSALVCHFC
jgi:hypothetical protein